LPKRNDAPGCARFFRIGEWIPAGCSVIKKTTRSLFDDAFEIYNFHCVCADRYRRLCVPGYFARGALVPGRNYAPGIAAPGFSVGSLPRISLWPSLSASTGSRIPRVQAAASPPYDPAPGGPEPRGLQSLYGRVLPSVRTGRHQSLDRRILSPRRTRLFQSENRPIISVKVNHSASSSSESPSKSV